MNLHCAAWFVAAILTRSAAVAADEGFLLGDSSTTNCSSVSDGTDGADELKHRSYE